MHFRNSLRYSGKLANTPSSEKNKLQPGPSPAFSAVASCRWCSARQGLPGLQRGGTWVEEFKSYLNYLYSWINIEAKYEHVTVTKVVILALKILEQFSLYFSDFSTILYVFYKFAVLKFMYILHFRPWKFRIF